MKGKCIYCGRDGELSGEHYLPRCLGKFRGYELLNDRICKDCNNSFSPLDEQFCRSGPEAIVRDMLGVEGRKGHKKVSPFQRGSSGAERLTFKGRAAAGDSAEEFDLDVDRKSRSVRRLRQITFFSGERRITVRITDDMREPEQLLRKMKERGVEMAAPSDDDTEIIRAVITGAAEDEFEWLQHLLSGVKDNILGEPEFRFSGPEQEAKVTINASPTEKYFRGLAKIGFHYFLKHMSGFQGSEDAFAGVRDFIMNGKVEDVDRFVSGRMNHIITDIIPSGSPAGYRHLLIARSNYEQLLCKISSSSTLNTHRRFTTSTVTRCPSTRSTWAGIRRVLITRRRAGIFSPTPTRTGKTDMMVR